MSDPVVEPKKFENMNDAEKIAELQGQVRYAQTIIKNLQTRVNDYTGVAVQLEAKLQIALEDRDAIAAQLKDKK